MELATRIQSSGDGQVPLRVGRGQRRAAPGADATNGTEGGVLAQTTVDVGAIPGYDATAPVILESQAAGTQLTCCVRGVAGATVTISDARHATGAPGLRATAQSTAFDDVVVSAP